MALYINGRPVNPIVTFLAGAAVIACMIGLGILLLPIIGGLFVIALIAVVCIALYGAWCRWRYGDPFAQMQKKAEAMMRREEQAEAADEPREERRGGDLKPGTARTGIRRTTTVEDAVVVEEIRRKDI